MTKHFLFILLVLGTAKTTISQSTNRLQSELIIKTVVAKGSVRVNEFGEHSDWLELYNTTNESIHLADSDYYITDDPKRRRKFKLKKGIVPPKASIVVWCDDEGRFKEHIHANFKLSSQGETLIVSKLIDKQSIVVDEITFSALVENGHRALVRHNDELRLIPLVTHDGENFGCVSGQ